MHTSLQDEVSTKRASSLITLAAIGGEKADHAAYESDFERSNLVLVGVGEVVAAPIPVHREVGR
jgi:hypothetical protein